MLGRFFSNFTRPQTHTGVGPLRKASDVRILLDFDMFVTSSNDCGAMLPPRCPQGHFHFQEIHQDHQGIALDLNDELLHLFLKQTKHTEEQTHRGK